MSIWSSLTSYFSGSDLFSMASIGSLGDTVFVASDRTVRTINDFKREAKARLSSHPIIGSKPLIEFLGPDLQTVSFTMKFTTMCGVNPKTEYEKLLKHCEAGDVLQLILNGQPVGENKWIITEVSEAVNYFDGHGKIISATATISLQEYAGENNKTGVNLSDLL